MSTKNIRKALQALADTQDAGMGGLAYAALAEVEAIEKAARVVVDVLTRPRDADMRDVEPMTDALAVLERVAKEAE